MIDRENLPYIKNILSLNNEDVDLTDVYNILTSIKEDNTVILFNTILDNLNIDSKKLKEILIPLLHAIKENDNSKIFSLLLDLVNIDFNHSNELKNIIIPLLQAIKENDEYIFYSNVLEHTNPEVDKILLESVLKTIKHNIDLYDDIYDSYSSNQFASKNALLNAINSINILNKESTVFIWGCWYGSILVPSLSDKVKQIIGIDLDKKSIQIGKKIFNNYENVDFQHADVFEKYFNTYKETNLIINTSCEHMLPMKDWKWFGPGALEEDTFKGLKGEGFGSPKLSSECYFAFQSNNMFDIEGHINCVNSLEEFKNQMPSRANILYEEEVEDTRGTRYMLIGKFMPL